MARGYTSKLSKTLKSPIVLFAIVAGLIYWLLNRSVKYSPVWINSPYKGWRDVIIAQSQHETGNFTSDVFKELKNAFGIKCVQSRKTTQIGCSTTNKGDVVYGVYRSSGDSLRDLFLWLDDFNFPKARTKAEVETILKGRNIIDYYVSFLKSKNYFGDTYYNYRNGVQSFYRKNLGKQIEIPE